MNQELTTLERELAAHFEMHPDAETFLSLPGLGSSSAPGFWPSSVTTQLASTF